MTKVATLARSQDTVKKNAERASETVSHAKTLIAVLIGQTFMSPSNHLTKRVNKVIGALVLSHFFKKELDDSPHSRSKHLTTMNF